MGDMDPHRTHGSLGPPESEQQLDRFSRFALLTIISYSGVIIGKIYVVLRCGLKHNTRQAITRPTSFTTDG